MNYELLLKGFIKDLQDLLQRLTFLFTFHFFTNSKYFSHFSHSKYSFR